MAIKAYTTPVFPPANIAHGFFTRAGGVSSGLYQSLNCGPGSDDRPEDVAENRQRVARHLSGRDAPLATMYQIHSNKVVITDKAFTAGSLPHADALVTNTKGLVLGVLTADCAPVLLADSKAGVIAVAHAGWRGALAGVCEETVKSMETLGADRKNIKAAIGPCIGKDFYEVGLNFFEHFMSTNLDYKKFFGPGKRDKFYFDLASFVKLRLEGAGVKGVYTIALDTYREREKFFSYRRMCHREEADYGRQISAIYLPE